MGGLGKPSQKSGIKAVRAQLIGPSSDLRIPTHSVGLRQRARGAGSRPDPQGCAVKRYEEGAAGLTSRHLGCLLFHAPPAECCGPHRSLSGGLLLPSALLS